jgi:hypothetical protein
MELFRIKIVSLSKLNVDLPAKRIKVETYGIVNCDNIVIFSVREGKQHLHDLFRLSLDKLHVKII